MAKVMAKPIKDETKVSEPSKKIKATPFTAYCKGYFSGILNEKMKNPYKTNPENVKAWNRGKEQGDNNRLHVTKDFRRSTQRQNEFEF